MYKMIFCVFLFIVAYSAVFLYILFSNFITVLGIFKFHPRSVALAVSVAESLSSQPQVQASHSSRCHSPNNSPRYP